MKYKIKLAIISLFFSIVCATVFAQADPFYTETNIDLWPKGLPNTNGKDNLPPVDSLRIYKPSIRVFLPVWNKPTGRAVIALPGGGYHGLAYNHEGYDFARFFANQGIALIVLKYRMPFGHREVPFSDVEEAIRLVKEHAKEWDINPNDIGIMGSSAGGHLATTIAARIKPALRPAFQILLYPVITMDSSYTHRGSRRNLLGEHPPDELVKQYSNEKQVHKETPRAFIAFSDDDKGVSPVNGVNYYLALRAHNIPATLHIYPAGGHGWGIRDNFKYKAAFLQDLKDWLQSF